MFVRILDQYLHEIALLQPASIAQMDFAVDFRRVGLGAAGGADIMVVLRMGSIEVPAVRAFRLRSTTMMSAPPAAPRPTRRKSTAKSTCAMLAG